MFIILTETWSFINSSMMYVSPLRILCSVHYESCILSLYSHVLLTATIGLPDPLGTAEAHFTHHISAHQPGVVWALQGDDGPHVGSIALDDPLGAQGWQRPGGALLGKGCKLKHNAL